MAQVISFKTHLMAPVSCVFLFRQQNKLILQWFLRLTFSGKLTDSELERYSAKFDADLGAFVIKCEKQVPGEHFADLDMLTTLLAPHGASAVKKPLIEVVGGRISSTFLYLISISMINA